MAVEIPIFIADAFSAEAFHGNPAAICLTDQELPNDVMQNIATEMNLSETAFVTKLKPEDTFENSNHFALRWYTPINEVVLCGHATVATSKVLFECYGNNSSKLSFETLSGTVCSSLQDDGTIVLDFPKHEPHKAHESTRKKTEFLQDCGYKIIDVQFSPPTKKLLVRLDDSVTRSQFESLSPPISEFLERIPNIKGIIMTVIGGKDKGCVDANGKPYDMLSRYFAPWDGVDEDPVCGSAHAVLLPYWSKVLGKSTLYTRQCSRRGGELHLKLRDNGRVDIGGKARVVLRGTFFM